MIAAHYPYRGWIAAGHARRSSGCARCKPARACRPSTPRVAELLDREARLSWTSARAAGRLAAVRGLRALSLHARARPRTRRRPRSGSSTRRPTPSATRAPSTTCGSSACSRPAPEPSSSGTVRFLQAAGERHQGVERRLELPATPLGELVDGGAGRRVQLRRRGRSCAGGLGCGPTRLGEPGSARSRSASTTRPSSPDAAAIDRPAALRASLLSTHVVLEASGGPLRLARSSATGARRRRGRGLRERQHLAGARLRRRRRGARRRDRPSRPPADRAREPRQPVRQHRDRGGAAAPRPGAERRRARARSPPRTRRCGR